MTHFVSPSEVTDIALTADVIREIADAAIRGDEISVRVDDFGYIEVHAMDPDEAIRYAQQGGCWTYTPAAAYAAALGIAVPADGRTGNNWECPPFARQRAYARITPAGRAPHLYWLIEICVDGRRASPCLPDRASVPQTWVYEKAYVDRAGAA